MGENSNQVVEIDKKLEEAARSGDVSFLKKEVSREKESNGKFQRFLMLVDTFFKGNILHHGIRYNKYEWVEEAVKLLPSDIIEKLLYQGDEDGDTPLHYAFYWDNLEFIQGAAKKNLFPKWVFNKVMCLKNNSGETLLHVAARRPGMLETVKVLYEYEYNGDKEMLWSVQNNEGNTPLHLAAYWGRHQVIEYLLMKHPGLASILNNDNNSILHIAAEKGYINIFQIVDAIDKDGKLKLRNMKNTEGNTPLHVAAMKGAFEIVKILIDKQPDLAREKNKSESTPLDVACSNNMSAVALYIASEIPELAGNRIIKNNSGDTQLHLAASYGNVDAAKTFLKQNHDLSRVTNNSKNTPLHVAVTHGHVLVAEFLINHDPELVGHSNDKKETPLHLAIKHDKDSIIDDKVKQGEEIPTMLKLLVEKASDVVVEEASTEVVTEKKLAEKAVVEKAQAEVVTEKKLVDKASGSVVEKAKGEVVAEKKCVACCLDADGWTPLHRAAFLCTTYNVRVVKSIIEQCKESAEVLDRSGNTILHLLIDRVTTYNQGLDLLHMPQITAMRYMKNEHGKTPLDLAWKTNIKMVRALLDSSPQQSVEGMSPSSLFQQRIKIEVGSTIVFICIASFS